MHLERLVAGAMALFEFFGDGGFPGGSFAMGWCYPRTAGGQVLCSNFLDTLRVYSLHFESSLTWRASTTVRKSEGAYAGEE